MYFFSSEKINMYIYVNRYVFFSSGKINISISMYLCNDKFGIYTKDSNCMSWMEKTERLSRWNIIDKERIFEINRGIV